MINGMNLGKGTVKNVSGMKLGKRENFEKTPKKPNIAHHSGLLVTLKLEFGTTVSTSRANQKVFAPIFFSAK